MVQKFKLLQPVVHLTSTLPLVKIRPLFLKAKLWEFYRATKNNPNHKFI